MPVVGVASKLRQPSVVGGKPVHPALPIPSAVRAATSQGYAARQQELGAGLSCQLSIKSGYQRTPEGKSRADTEESKICKVSSDGSACRVVSLTQVSLSLFCWSRCSSGAELRLTRSGDSCVLVG